MHESVKRQSEVTKYERAASAYCRRLYLLKRSDGVWRERVITTSRRRANERALLAFQRAAVGLSVGGLVPRSPRYADKVSALISRCAKVFLRVPPHGVDVIARMPRERTGF